MTTPDPAVTPDPVVPGPPVDTPPNLEAMSANVNLVTQVAKGVEGVDAEQVALVLAHLAAIQGGEPLGTIKRDPVTGHVATRIDLNGIHKWQVMVPNTGEQWYDNQPTMPNWDVVYSPDTAAP